MALTESGTKNNVIRLIPEANVHKAIAELAHNGYGGITSDQEEVIFSNLLNMCKPITISGQRFYQRNIFNQFCKNLKHAIEYDDSSILFRPRGRKFEPVDIIEFVESFDYYGQKGSVWPSVKQELWEIFHGKDADGNPRYIVEIVFGGCIGGGKNYRADAIQAYLLYNLSSYHDPQLEFGLAPGSSIVFAQQSKTLSLARKVVFDQFAARIRNSPYFRKNFMFDPNVKSELRFPNNIYVYPLGGTDTAAIGMNVWSCIVDELNFMLRTQDSVILQYTGESEFDQAERLYRQVIGRIRSRFREKGKVPGKLILISSANYPGDFISRKVESAKDDPTIYCSVHAQWEMIPREKMLPETFFVELGDEVRPPRVLVDKEAARPGAELLEVPMDYYVDFRDDIDGAMRDIAGRPIGASNPFIVNKESIITSQEKYDELYGGISAFTVSQVVFNGIPSSPDKEIELIVSEQFLAEMIDIDSVYAIHVDLGVNKDKLGLAIGHISSYVPQERQSVYSNTRNAFVELQNVFAPFYTIDALLSCRAEKGSEIDLNWIKALCLYLHEFFGFGWGTADTFQSTYLLQAFRAANPRIRSGPLSVDTSMAPYLEVREAMNEGRIVFPKHELLTHELSMLQRVLVNGKLKVEHNGDASSKDLSDAVAGVVHILQTKVATYKSSLHERGSTASRIKTRRQRIAEAQEKRQKEGGTVRKSRVRRISARR